MPDLRIAALIPAAGLSSRMKAFKPLIDLGGQTLVERVVNLFETAGIDDIITVVGHRCDELIRVLDRTASRWVLNPNYRDGMFASIQQGLRELSQSCDAFFVLPVDIPLVRSLTVQQLMKAFHHRSSLVCYPQFNSQRGHPPVVDSCLIDEMLAYNGQGGMRAFLQKYSSRAETVPVADAYIGMDVDTDSDLALLRKALQRYTIPSLDECQIMLAHYFNVSAAIDAHSRKVAEVARRLGASLNANGCSYDLDLLTATGLLHDVYKGHQDHAGKAAAKLRAAGFPEVAEIVADHMDLNIEGNVTINETSLLHLADKIVQGDRVVNLDTRKSVMMKKYAHDASIQQRISARFNTAQKIQSQIEDLVGSTLQDILGDVY
jgi:CTP:molybdopterin cytidylyltransferase MocA